MHRSGRLYLAVALGIAIACAPAVMPISTTTPTPSVSPPIIPTTVSPSTTALSPDKWPLWQRLDLEGLLPIDESPRMELGWPLGSVTGPKNLVATTYHQDVTPDNRIITTLRVVDTSTGSVVVADTVLDHLVWGAYPFGSEGDPPIEFDQTGTALYWFHPVDAAYGGEGWNLFRRSLQFAGEPEVIHRFADGFEPWSFRVLDGRLAIFATNDGQPFLYLIEAETGRLLADTSISGLAAVTEGNANGAGFAIPGLAWDVDRSRLYIGSAEGDQVFLLDLASGTVANHATVSGSWRQALAEWLLPVAHAKSSFGVSRNASLSPSGDRLYLAGVSTKSTVSAYENLTQSPLLVIDTSTLELVDQLELEATDLEVSPDGRLLFLTGVRDRGTVDLEDPKPSGLFILDAQSLEVVDHRYRGSYATVEGFSPMGDQVVISWGNPETDAYMISTLALPTLDPLVERIYDTVVDVEAGLILVEGPPATG